ncbi:MAG: LysM peptidoglycan-binding domain-containing protein [Acidimicrobiia bacterium]|nr:LysM peptidoglycan-binding domain-containing protein [Acidimicrobiia bacterium]
MFDEIPRMAARSTRAVSTVTAVFALLVLGSAAYEVQPGDTLSEIARDANLDLNELALHNGIDDAHYLSVGQIIRFDGPPVGIDNQAGAAGHVVAEGDYLSTIARDYGVSIAALVDVNGLTNPDRLVVGQTLFIPTAAVSSGASTVAGTGSEIPVERPAERPAFHVVAAGEYLSTIARVYGMSTEELVRRNGISDPHHLLPGRRLLIGWSGERQITVSAGQTISEIAAEHLSTVGAIVEANQIADATAIQPGDVLMVPLPFVSDTAQSVSCEASWYGDFFAGRPTASGELFDTSRMTAASHFVPMHTWVDVVRPDTGAVVRVKINDRGPYHLVHDTWLPHPDRCIDLSEAAAVALGSRERGVVPVVVTFPAGVPEVDRLQALYGSP